MLMFTALTGVRWLGCQAYTGSSQYNEKPPCFPATECMQNARTNTNPIYEGTEQPPKYQGIKHSQALRNMVVARHVKMVVSESVPKKEQPSNGNPTTPTIINCFPQTLLPFIAIKVRVPQPRPHFSQAYLYNLIKPLDEYSHQNHIFRHHRPARAFGLPQQKSSEYEYPKEATSWYRMTESVENALLGKACMRFFHMGATVVSMRTDGKRMHCAHPKCRSAAYWIQALQARHQKHCTFQGRRACP